ncbi:hypothetical protein CDO73_16495 [Saccharibacillus sp. O23]|uniref:DUF4339 domain-containing protein n=1 Tax=Saccharibacillus sp. O23 TaxID=2009338 RepID=UPI000B4E195C|nr:DUF4339 domain-containing protein [Saccharibacillus sp. O23]OWR29000.1 hypothetical protein CDO73_16495 [Saccharibacillus sp. O23]
MTKDIGSFYSWAELAERIGAEYPGAEAADRLSDRAANKVCRKLLVSSGDSLRLFFDATVLGKYRSGVAFTDRGIYWRSNSATGFVGWEEFGQEPLPEEGYLDDAIRLGERKLSTTGLKMERDVMLELLTRIRASAGTLSLPPYGPIPLRLRNAAGEEADLRTDEYFLLYLCRRSGYFKPEHFDSERSGMRRQPQYERFGFGEASLLAFREEGLRAQGAYGVALSSEGLHIRNQYSFRREGLRESFLSFRRIAGLKRIELEKSTLKLDGVSVYNAIHGRDFARLLKGLRLYLSSLQGIRADAALALPYSPSHQQPWESPSTPTDEDEDLLVSEGGRPRGVYSKSQIRFAIRKGLLNPDDAYFWQEGSSRWQTAGEAGLLLLVGGET